MLGRFIVVLLIPLWVAIIALIFCLAIVTRIMHYATDLLDVVGGFMADLTKLVIETLSEI
jgi:hypothetical protein